MARVAGLRYSRVASSLHWVIAFLVIANILLALFRDQIGDAMPGLMNIHKSIGFTVLAFSIVALLWRLLHRPPPMPVSMPASTQAIARIMHALLYALMILMPTSGWIMSSAGRRPLNWFELFDIPKFAVERGDIVVTISGLHGLTGLLFGLLALGHIGAALWHQFVKRDQLLARMA